MPDLSVGALMRMKVPDEQAIQAFWTVASKHRVVVVFWLLKNYRWVDVTPGYEHAKPDRNALAIEIFSQYMAQLEALEMTYFALREKARTPEKSLLDIYAGIRIKEQLVEGTPPAKHSARQMLSDLEGMTPATLLKDLGLPAHEELRACCGGDLKAPRAPREEFEARLQQEIQWLKQAVGNKDKEALHRAYIKLKHGFLVLAHPEQDDVFAVTQTKTLAPDQCEAEVLQIDTSEQVVIQLARDVDVIGGMITRLWGLYLGRSPCEECDTCRCREEAGDWMEETTRREVPTPRSAPNITGSPSEPAQSK
jgi:hypothetical protein